MKKSYFKKYILVILLIIWCLFIFYLSHQNSNVSGNNSTNILSYILNNLLHLNIDLDVIINLNENFRTFMHGFMFFTLGILSVISLNSFLKRNSAKYSIIFCLVYALIDEIHQLFIPGRAFQISDLIIDGIGSALAIIIVNFILYKVRKEIKL